jgi:hypothetical protein
MSPGYRLRVTSLGFTLIALAVQAITPDPHDMTSFSILRILRSLRVDSLPPTDAATPSNEDPQQDENADEVCEPSWAGAQITARRPTIGSRRLPREATRHRPSAGHSPSLHRPRRPGATARTGDLMLILCRLTC